MRQRSREPCHVTILLGNLSKPRSVQDTPFWDVLVKGTGGHRRRLEVEGRVGRDTEHSTLSGCLLATTAGRRHSRPSTFDEQISVILDCSNNRNHRPIGSGLWVQDGSSTGTAETFPENRSEHALCHMERRTNENYASVVSQRRGPVNHDSPTSQMSRLT